MAQYSIHEDNMQKLADKLAHIEKKCNKYGCTFSYAEVGEEYKEVQHYKEIYGAYGKEEVKTHKTIERFIIVEVEGIAIINDWKFVATLEHTEAGNIIRQYNTEVELPDYYRTCKPTCEHCHSDRYRKDTYIIRNTVTNELKQVGKSCLKDFTNGLSAEAVAQFLSYFNTIQELNDHESLGGFTRKYVNVSEYLTAVIEVVNKCGFVSKAKSEEGKQATSSKVYSLMYPMSRYDTEEVEKLDFVADRQENKEAVKNMLAWLEVQKANSQYISNLQLVCKKEYAEFRDMGLLASLPSAYFKAMETEKERLEREARKSDQPTSQHVGKVGDKIQLTNVTITKVAVYETQYGFTHIFKILDTNGNIYIWKASKGCEVKEVIKGEYCNYESKAIEDFTALKGTIKAHNEYNGELQTELTRCKVM
jgi:hypothetical protein